MKCLGFPWETNACICYETWCMFIKENLFVTVCLFCLCMYFFSPSHVAVKHFKTMVLPVPFVLEMWFIIRMIDQTFSYTKLVISDNCNSLGHLLIWLIFTCTSIHIVCLFIMITMLYSGAATKSPSTIGHLKCSTLLMLTAGQPESSLWHCCSIRFFSRLVCLNSQRSDYPNDSLMKYFIFTKKRLLSE